MFCGALPPKPLTPSSKGALPKIGGVQAIEPVRKAFASVRLIAISGGGNFGIAAYEAA